MAEPRDTPLVALDLPERGRRVLYAAQPKQLLLHQSRAPNVLYGGAAGPGKSHGLRWHCIMACLHHSQFRALVLRRHFTELEITHLLAIKSEVPPELAHYDASRHRLEFPNGSILQFGHCNTDDDFAQYLSSEWGMIGVDEAGQFTAWQLAMLQSRIRSTDPEAPCQYVLATNPGGPGHHWLKARFLDRVVSADEDPTYRPDAYAFIPAVVGDNAYLPASYLDRLRALPKEQRAAYLEGNWDAFVGQVFSEWARSAHVLPERFEVPAGWAWSAGLDWGYRNPLCFLLFAQSPKGEAVCWREWYTTGVTAFEAGARTAELLRAIPGTGVIYGDEQMWYNTGTAEFTVGEEYERGLRANGSRWGLIPATHGPHSRIPKLNLLHEALAWDEGHPPRLRFHPRCVNTIRTLPALGYDKAKPEDVDRTQESHAYDAVCCWLTSRPQVGTVPVAPGDRDAHPGLTLAGVRKERAYEKAYKQWIEAEQRGGKRSKVLTEVSGV